MANQLTMQCLVTVIIPTFNGEPWIEDVLTMLDAQSLSIHEVLVVDSGSTDQTVSVCQRHGVRVISIPNKEFDHGGTRNMAAMHAQGDILVYLTQDAVPTDASTLEKLVAPLLLDESIAVTYARQLPHFDATPLSKHLRFYNYPEHGYIRCWQDRKVYGFKTIFISNSCAAYRKDVLAEVGFFPDNVLFGEDTCTLAKLLQHGFCVQYVSDAKVYHSHNYTFVQDVKRYFDIGVLHTLEQTLVSNFGSPTGAGKRFVLSEISFLFKRKKYILIFPSLLRNILKYVAYGLGRRYSVLPRSLARTLSMHHRWWK